MHTNSIRRCTDIDERNKNGERKKKLTRKQSCKVLQDPIHPEGLLTEVKLERIGKKSVRIACHVRKTYLPNIVGWIEIATGDAGGDCTTVVTTVAAM